MLPIPSESWGEGTLNFSLWYRRTTRKGSWSSGHNTPIYLGSPSFICFHIGDPGWPQNLLLISSSLQESLSGLIEWLLEAFLLQKPAWVQEDVWALWRNQVWHHQGETRLTQGQGAERRHKGVISISICSGAVLRYRVLGWRLSLNVLPSLGTYR